MGKYRFLMLARFVLMAVCQMYRQNKKQQGVKMNTRNFVMAITATTVFAAVDTACAGYSSLAERIRATGASSWAGSQSSSYSENAAGKCYVSSSRADAGYSSLADKIRANGAIDGANTRSLSSYANATGVYSSSEPVGMDSGTGSLADYSCYDGIVSKKKVSGPSYSFEEEEMSADGGTAGKNELVLVADDDDASSATDDGAADRNEPVFVVYDAGATTDDTSDKTTVANPVLASCGKNSSASSSKSLMQQMNDEFNYLMSDELRDDLNAFVAGKDSDGSHASDSGMGLKFKKTLEYTQSLKAKYDAEFDYLKRLDVATLTKMANNMKLLNQYLATKDYSPDFGL